MQQTLQTPGVVKWTGYTAVALLLLLPLSVLMVRSGQWQPGLALYALANLGSALLLILSVVLLLASKFAPWRKQVLRGALFALPGTALLLSLTTGGNFPRIHDVTTDTVDPPTFTLAAQQRGPDANTLDIDPETIALQKAAYPDIATLKTALSVEDAFNRALQTATGMGWTIYRQDPQAGVIEAVATTAVMAFKDDVVIRVRGSDAGTLLDLRSVSRVGGGDIGANAKRIRAFRDAFAQ